MTTTAVIGANRGIGLEISKQLRTKHRHRVIAVCRQASDELRAAETDLLEGIDITDPESVQRLAAELPDGLDGLLLVAGILRPGGLDSLDFDAVREQLEVNAIGPLRVIAGVQHRLQDGAKIAILTSRMGSMADNSSGGAYGYRMSKAAVNAAGVSLARDLAPRNIAVGLFHPGYVKTEMTGNRGNLTPEASAAMLLDRFNDLNMEHSGVFWHANGEELPW